jgi:hypothetical protein
MIIVFGKLIFAGEIDLSALALWLKPIAFYYCFPKLKSLG